MNWFGKLRGRRTGDGKRVVVLSHGFGTDQDAWTALRPWFEARFDVVSFDLPGCGPMGAESYDFERHGSIFGYADDFVEFMDEMGLQGCTFVGHSMSCMIGAVAASARPDLFDRMVMIGASPRYLNDADYVGGFEQENLDQLYESMAANYQAWVAGFAPIVVGVDDGQAVADFSRTLFHMRPDIALNTSRTIFQSDMRQVVPRLITPVHLIQTSSDIAVPVQVGEWLKHAIPDATLDIIDAAGHLPHMTAPAEVIRIVEQYLA